jgi:CBS domain-containing protein
MLKIGPVRPIRISRWVKPETRLLDIASKSPVACGPTQRMADVVPMFSKRFRRLPVVDRKGSVKGMLSSSDVLRVLGGWGKFGRTKPADRPRTRVSSAMSPRVFRLDKNLDLQSALAAFKKHRAGAYPVMYRGALQGLATEWDVVRQIRGGTGVKVRDIMVRKPLVAQAGHGISDVAKMLALGGFRRLPVMNKGVLVGVVTPRDILGFLHANGLEGKLHEQGKPVRSIMERSVVSVNPGRDVHDAVKVMISRKIGGLLVTEGDELAGIVTERDVVDAAVF